MKGFLGGAIKSLIKGKLDESLLDAVKNGTKYLITKYKQYDVIKIFEGVFLIEELTW